MCGALLGAIYFGGLWWTVRQVAGAQRPYLVLLASWVVRVIAVLGGFYIVMNGQWERLLACLAGFVLSRIVLVRSVRMHGSVKQAGGGPRE